MRREITDLDCLRYWERRLAEHETLRPVTDGERVAIVAEHRARAIALRAAAARLRDCRPPTADAYGRGPSVLAERRADSVSYVHALQEAGHLEQQAVHAEGLAEAWLVADYAATLAELQGRVAYYRSLVARPR